VPERLKLGFVGGGLNSAVGRTHTVASQMDARWELVAGAFSRHDDVNQLTGRTWGVDPSRVYADWRSLLEAEAEALDAVVVLTPTPQHDEQVSALLAGGFDVICEKALAGSSVSADGLHQCAVEHGRFLAVTYNYSGYPMMRELRARIAAGELGRIVAVNVEMPQEGFLRLTADGQPIWPQEWRQHDGTVPTVSLDLGTHTHHLVQFLLGSAPLELVATQAHHGRVSTVADYVSCIAHYPEGVDVDMWYGKCALGHRNGLRIRVYGDKAAAEWVQMNPEELRISDAFANVRIVDRASPGTLVAGSTRYERFKVGHPAGFLEAFANLYWDFADALVEFRSTGVHSNTHVFGAAEAADGLRMLEAIARSSIERSWVSLGSDAS
jgi:predicted dehydrogenase